MVWFHGLMGWLNVSNALFSVSDILLKLVKVNRAFKKAANILYFSLSQQSSTKLITVTKDTTRLISVKWDIKDVHDGRYCRIPAKGDNSTLMFYLLKPGSVQLLLHVQWIFITYRKVRQIICNEKGHDLHKTCWYWNCHNVPIDADPSTFPGYKILK